MEKIVKRILVALMATVVCMSFGLTASAVELHMEDYNGTAQCDTPYELRYSVTDSGVVLLNSGSISPMSYYSSISGYSSKTVDGGSQYIIIPCTSSGIGGMGITIKTSCSKGNYTIQFAGCCQPGNGSASTIEGTMTTNEEKYFDNLWQLGNVTEYYILLSTASGTPSYTVSVWIYG